MPWPESIASTGERPLLIRPSFHVTLSCDSPYVARAAQRLISRLSRQTGIPLAANAPTNEPAALIISCGQAVRAPVEPAGNESYTLVTGPGGARLDAPSSLGALRGIETFLQLVQNGPSGFVIPAVRIVDAPRFAWRGLMLDVCRHFMPVDAILRQLDAMAVVKLNVFHWHLSDDQGFRVESRVFPNLQTKGSEGKFYTQGQIRQIVEYAADRGIRIVPEFDLPGHTSAILAAYPSLASG